MIKKEIGYAYNDLTLVPTIISNVKSRKDVECIDVNGRLPIFVAPMSAVINEKNYDVFEKNNLYTVIPRSVNFKERMKLFGNNGTLFNDMNHRFIALSLNEFKDCFCNDENAKYNNSKHYNVCVDIANGHMKQLYDLCKKAKSLSYKHGYELVIMTGNIANPDTYREICMMTMNHKPIVDYIRVGIGGGSGCFIDGTKVKTDNGEKNIEDICVDDRVLTIDGSYQRVFSRTRYKTNNLLKINDEITCTPNHKFFVINKSDKELINEQNLERIGFWVEAENLDKEKHLLVKME